jgi:hypothetical protein
LGGFPHRSLGVGVSQSVSAKNKKDKKDLQKSSGNSPWFIGQVIVIVQMTVKVAVKVIVTVKKCVKVRDNAWKFVKVREE